EAEVNRIERQGRRDDLQAFVEAAHRDEEKGMPEMESRGSGTETQRPLELARRQRPVPVVQRRDVRPSDVCLREQRIELERPGNGGLRARHRLPGRHGPEAIEGEESLAVGDLRVAHGIPGVTLGGPAKAVDGCLETLRGLLVPEVAALQVQRVGLRY